MFRLLILSFIVVFNAQASHLENVCKSATEMSPMFSDGVIARGNVLETLSGVHIHSHSSPIKSVVSAGESFWLLSNHVITELNKKGEILFQYDLEMNRNMVLAGNFLVIVRSGGVVSLFDIQKKELVWTSYIADINDGVAVTAAFDGVNILLVMTGTREFGFNGIATISLNNGELIRKTPYNPYNAGVIHPLVKARWHNDQLILNNGGWIHVINKKQLNSSRGMKPRWIAHAVGTGSGKHYMMLKGEFFIEGNTLVGCGIYHELQDGDFNFYGKLFKVPLL